MKDEEVAIKCEKGCYKVFTKLEYVFRIISPFITPSSDFL